MKIDLLTKLNGPQEVGKGKIFWVLLIFTYVALLIYSFFASPFSLSNIAVFFAYVPMGVGLSLLWGYCGVLSFGQAAFFGVAGYVYGIIAGNIGSAWLGTVVGIVAGISASMLLAAAFGYFVFYGQVSGWIIPLLTLVLSLILETFMGQTAGYQWRIGSVLFGGYNGMTGIPSLKIGSIEFQGATQAFYILVILVSFILYMVLRVLVNSKYGFTVAGIREDVERTRMLGYNVNLIQVQIFMISAGLAGLSGILYVSWGNYMNPSSMGMLAATLPVIWTAVGGRRSLMAVMIMTLVLKWLSDALAVKGGEYAFLILGALLLVTMLFFPEGIIITIVRRFTNTKLDKVS